MAQRPEDENRNYTRHLRPRNEPTPMPDRQTQPLDLDVPRKLRFIFAEMTSVYEFPLQSYMVVGRKNSIRDNQVDVDLSPFDAHRYGVSRYHAIITVVNGRISLKDFNSTNGTYLNGFALQPMHAYRLRHGDEITFGEMTVKIHFVGVSAPDA